MITIHVAACACASTRGGMTVRFEGVMDNPSVDISERLTRWIATEFAPGSAAQVIEALRALSPQQVGGQDSERVLAALVVRTAGEWDRFIQNRSLLDQDWRDVLVRADLADQDWPHRLDAILGSV